MSAGFEAFLWFLWEIILHPKISLTSFFYCNRREKWHPK